MHGIVKKKPRARSAITSGNRLFSDRVDLRTSRGLRLKDLIDCYTHDAGGADKISEASRSLIRRLAFIQCQLEDAEQSYIVAGECDADERADYLKLSAAQSRLMKAIGLIGTRADDADDDAIDPLDYVERGLATHALDVKAHTNTSHGVKRKRIEDDDED